MAAARVCNAPGFAHGWVMLTGYGSRPAQGVALLIFSLLALLFAGVIVRGGWHMLTLERYRPALLASFLGQPVGILGLIVLSRPEVKAAFANDGKAESGFFSWGLVTTLGAVLVSAAGIGFVFQSWVTILNQAMSPAKWFEAAGFGWWQGMAACFSFGGVLLLLLATALLRPVPVWRPLLVAVAGVAVLACSSSFIVQTKNRTLPVQPLLDAASWSIEIDGRIPETINEARVATQIDNGPYLMMAAAIGLLLIAALEFGRAMRQRAQRQAEESPQAAPAARISGKVTHRAG